MALAPERAWKKDEVRRRSSTARQTTSCRLRTPSGWGPALVVSDTFGEEEHLVLDDRAIGVVVAAIALALRAPVLLAVALAAITTALVRAFV